MGLGPLGGTFWGDVATFAGTVVLVGGAAFGALYIAVTVIGYVALSLTGML